MAAPKKFAGKGSGGPARKPGMPAKGSPRPPAKEKPYPKEPYDNARHDVTRAKPGPRKGSGGPARRP